MRIIVCVKQVPDPTIVKFNIETRQLDNVSPIIDPLDEVALSEAIELREKNGGGVTAINLAPPESEAVLRYCLKLGADKAIHVWDESFQNLDIYATSVVLAKAIAREPYDIILCGRESMDECNGFLGIAIAEWLDLPLVTCATRIDVFTDTGSAVVHRRLRGGDREIIESPLPAVFTVESILTKPVYPSLHTILTGLKKDIVKLDAASLGIQPDEITPRLALIGISQPKPRLKKTATIDSSLSPAERMKLIAAGGVQQKKSNIIEKLPKVAASEIIKFLIENGIIRGES